MSTTVVGPTVSSSDNVTATLEPPAAAGEAQQPAPREVPLFDSSVYVIDGKAADKIRVVFTGTVDIDPVSDADVYDAIIGMKLGRQVDLRVSGFVAGKYGKTKFDSEGDETVTGGVTVKIDSWQLAD